MDVGEIKKLKVPELRKELEARGLDSTGLKPALVERLEANFADRAPVTMTGAPQVSSPLNGASIAPSSSEQPPEKAAAVNGNNHTKIEFKPSSNEDAEQQTTLQKKQARAKRFGIPLTGEDQKALRAERFGTATSGSLPPPAKTASGSLGTAAPKDASHEHKSSILTTKTPMDEAAKAAELEKRKARAARFELPVVSNDEEQAKKKARASGNAPNGKSTGAKGASTAAPVVSEEEAAKRQARALRFSTGLPAAKADSSGTTAEQIKKLEERKIRFGAGKVGETASTTAQQATPSAQA